MKVPKFLIFGIVIVIVIGLALSITSSGFDEGSPEGTLSMTITEVGTGNEFTGITDIGPLTLGQSLFGGQALTVFTQELVGIQNNSEYTITFVIDTTIEPKEGVTPPTGVFTGICKTTGTSPNPTVADEFKYGRFATITIAGDTVTQGGFGVGETVTYTHNTFEALIEENNNNGHNIKGSELDGSLFTTIIEVRDSTSGGLTYFGTTTVTLEFNVNQAGNIDIIVTGINGVVS